MPFVNYICPDGVEIRIESCLTKCRMTERCLSLPTLMLMSRRRTWKGKISATQALNGTRLEYLKQMHDYAEAPVNRAFALLGTLHHLRLQNVQIPDALMEEWLQDEEGTGIPDLLHEGVLWDYKTTSAYKVCRWQGRKKEEEVIPAGEEGHGVFRSGARKGQPRTRKVWSMTEPDIFDLQMQISRYAWFYRDMGFAVFKALVQATIRDFNARTPVQYGVDRQIVVIPIPILDREVVMEFYRMKQDALIHALDKKELPPPCTDHETWEGKRCQSYCPVWMHCDVGIKAHEEPIKEEEDEQQA